MQIYIHRRRLTLLLFVVVVAVAAAMPPFVYYRYNYICKFTAFLFLRSGRPHYQPHHHHHPHRVAREHLPFHLHVIRSIARNRDRWIDCPGCNSLIRLINELIRVVEDAEMTDRPTHQSSFHSPPFDSHLHRTTRRDGPSHLNVHLQFIPFY